MSEFWLVSLFFALVIADIVLYFRMNKRINYIEAGILDIACDLEKHMERLN